MQRFAFAKVPCLMREMPGFASKPVMNFKILGIIHRLWPIGRCARPAECEYFPVYLRAWSPTASTVLSLHFEIDTGLPVLQEGHDRGAFSLPETSSLRVLLSATDLGRIALFSGLLNRAPISGNVPYLFGCTCQFVSVGRFEFARFWMHDRHRFRKVERQHTSADTICRERAI